jgi:hypothetical protein|uniref:HEAT repeat domain-containing protein n=1 Tax=Gracilinema caldarium TaxID=215591 RepID=A0A7C3I3I5_9SPIR
MYTIQYLKDNSNLPGPRGNLELLYSFSKDATEEEINECIKYIQNDTENSPEEFVGMCGIVGYSVHNKDKIEDTLDYISKFASHKSWRIREAVAMGIQEISVNKMKETLKNITKLINGNCFEKRAVVAGLCEPKLLKEEETATSVLKVLNEITEVLDHNNKLSDEEESLRKALGYGWSVAIVHAPENGKKMLEMLLKEKKGKHIKWIIKENLKKNRLIKMDIDWVKEMENRLTTAST